MTCSQVSVPASEASAEMQSCMSGGGTPGTSCPTAGLAGCCTVTSGGVSAEACYYMAASASQDQSACTSSGGTWSTTP